MWGDSHMPQDKFWSRQSRGSEVYLPGIRAVLWSYVVSDPSVSLGKASKPLNLSLLICKMGSTLSVTYGMFTTSWVKPWLSIYNQKRLDLTLLEVGQTTQSRKRGRIRLKNRGYDFKKIQISELVWRNWDTRASPQPSDLGSGTLCRMGP